MLGREEAPNGQHGVPEQSQPACKWGRGTMQAGYMWCHAMRQQVWLAGKQRTPSSKR